MSLKQCNRFISAVCRQNLQAHIPQKIDELKADDHFVFDQENGCPIKLSEMGHASITLRFQIGSNLRCTKLGARLEL